VEVFFDEFVYVGESRLGIYRPPGGSETVLLKEFPDEAILRLFPTRVGAFGQWVRRVLLLSALGHRRRPPLSLDIFPGPLGSVRRRDVGSGAGVLWYTGNLEGSQSVRRSRLGERSELPCVGMVSHGPL